MKDAAVVTCQHKTLIIINKLKIFHSQNSTKSRTLAVSIWSETYWFPAHWGLRWVLHQRSSWCWHLEDKQMGQSRVCGLHHHYTPKYQWDYNQQIMVPQWSKVRCSVWRVEPLRSSLSSQHIQQSYWLHIIIFIGERSDTCLCFSLYSVSFSQPNQHFSYMCMDLSADFLKCSDHYCPFLSNPTICVHPCRHLQTL